MYQVARGVCLGELDGRSVELFAARTFGLTVAPLSQHPTTERRVVAELTLRVEQAIAGSARTPGLPGFLPHGA